MPRTKIFHAKDELNALIAIALRNERKTEIERRKTTKEGERKKRENRRRKRAKNKDRTKK